MNKKTSLITLATIAVFTLISQGCATSRSNDSAYDASNDAQTQDVLYTVEKGDLLGDISLAITGAISNWKDIAVYNDITDPRTLKVGTVLSIPASLISTAKNSTADSSPDSASPNRTRIPATNALAVVQRSDDAEIKQADVVIQSVSINRSFELNPMQESDLANAEQSNIALAPPQIKVIGSYYPKGIYKEPASYSTLMMRVAPGTLFELERKVNDWYKVETSEGIGYLRAIDGVIVNNE